jgi:hypothetical protein
MRCSNSVPVYTDGMWQCGNCGSIACVPNHFDFSEFFKSTEPFDSDLKECTCGASKTSNPNCHAFYCDLSNV